MRAPAFLIVVTLAASLLAGCGSANKTQPDGSVIGTMTRGQLPEVTIDGRDAGTKRIDFERFGDFFHTDRTIYLTDDARYGALPVYLQRLGSEYTEVV